MNGDSASRLPSVLQYTFYKDSDFGAARLHPLGGPTYGGTLVHLYLIDDRLHVDLGGAAHGPTCRFAHGEQTTLVSANLTDCGGSRACGGGHRSLTCVAPRYVGVVDDTFVDTRVEVSINGQHFSSSGLTFRQYDPSAWRVLSLAPRGGPLTGNTSVELRGALLQPLGDVRCRFGNVTQDELVASMDADASVEATVDQTGSQVTCVSPPHWRRTQGTQHVEVELTLNGQDYMRMGALGIFTFYAVDEPEFGLSVQQLTPNGGPSDGGTIVTVLGSGFANLGGLLCVFEGEPVVTATISSQPNLITCKTPSISVLRSDASELRTLEVTLNGQRHASTLAGAVFRFYNSSSFHIVRLHPLGGPTYGGTLVHLYLIDDRLHVDLGGAAHGPTCRFAHGEQTTLVSANLTDCGGSRACGGGHRSLTCVAPRYVGVVDDTFVDTRVEVSINGQHFSSSGLTFRQYDPSAWRVLSLAPRGGPLTGNTSVELRGALLQPLGDVRCRFGRAFNEEADGTVDQTGQVTCVSPPHWQQSHAPHEVEVELTLNGQDYLRIGAHGIFTFFDVNAPASGLSVQQLTPNGGPSAGGTLVIVRGSGLVNFGRLLCLFEGEHAVNATMVDGEALMCQSPPTSPTTAFEPRSLEVSLNGQLQARTSAGVSFTYFRSGVDVRVSRIYPRGGRPEGGTLITVTGVGFRDLDHGRGLGCAFGAAPLTPARLSSGTEEASELLCESPPVTAANIDGVCGAVTRVAFRVTLNGNNSIAVTHNGSNGSQLALTQDEVEFVYHEL